MQRQGAITVTGTIDTSAFDYDGVMSLHADSSADIRGDIQLVSGTNIALSQVGQAITVNATGVAGTVWGTITGTLSSQTDLQLALDGKQPVGLLNGGFEFWDFGTSFISPPN